MPRTTKLYVGNLPQGSDENSVRVLFSEFGEVVECDIIKNFGFVHFTDIGDAMKAVDSLNNKEWKGSTLKVQQSHSKVHVKPGMGNRGECIRCGKTGHLCRDCPTVRTLDFKGGDIHEKTCATLSNISKEISATNGSIDGLYSFLGKSRDSWKRDSFNDRDNQSDFLRNWLRSDDNGDSNSRHNNSRDYRRNMSGSSDRYSNSNQPSRSSLGSDSYRHQPYLQAHARRLASIVAAARANLPSPSPSPSQSSSMMPNNRKIPPSQQQQPPSMQRSRPPSSSSSSSKPSSMPPPHSRPFSSLPPTPSSAVGRPNTNNNNSSSSNNNTNNNLTNREMNPNPFFRPPPEYYEQRRRKSQLRSQQH